ncbi:MMPL family transporter, partial [Actinomadura adrarensis]
EADVVVLYRSGDGTTVDDDTYRAAVQESLRALPGHLVESTATYWETRNPQMVGKDRTITYAVVRLTGDEAGRQDAFKQISDDLAKVDGAGLTAKVGGEVATTTVINEQVSSDIGKAEGMAFPILMLLLLVIFGGVVAASLPLVIGGLAILGSFVALHALSYVTDVSIFAINITTFLGLALAIDYGLFIVSRFREEIRRGRPGTNGSSKGTGYTPRYRLKGNGAGNGTSGAASAKSSAP